MPFRPKPQSEEYHGVQLMKWIALHVQKYPELELFHHIPNEGLRGRRCRASMAAQGLKAGVFDYRLPVIRRGRRLYCGLELELKHPKFKNRKNKGLTPAQRNWFRLCNAFGPLATVGFGWQDAVKKIELFLQMEKAQE